MVKQLAFQTLTPHLKNLRACGFYQLDPQTTPRLQFSLHQIYMRFSLSLPMIYAVQQIIYIYQVRSDANRVMDSMFLLLSFVVSIYKQIVFWLKADKIEEILDILKGPLFNQDDEIHKKILSAMVTRARITLRVFNSMTQATCVLWTLPSLLKYLGGDEVDFVIWLPFDANRPNYFYFVLFYAWLQTAWLGYNDSTMDAFTSFFFAQCTTQLTILRLDLETIVERSKTIAVEKSISFSKTIQRLFNVSLLHYGEIVRLAANIEDIFGGAVFCQFFATGWIICTTVFRTVNMNPASVEFSSMILYMCCILFELFLYCYFGNELTFESKKLMDSAYAMNWLETPVEHRKSLIIFMERIKKPIQPMAVAFIPLSASTFLSILRSSYTFYAFLKTTDQK